MMQVLSIESGAVTKECTPTGRLIVLTGPSGVGKGTLMRSLLKRHPELYYSVSVTTRSPRPKEIDGKDYYFINRSQFEQMVQRGEFLEWAEFAGNYYGTLRESVLNQIHSGKSVVLEIELQGARQIRETFPSALSIFILPPCLKELENRLRTRGQDSEEAICRRLQRAQEEINAADEFNVTIINDDFETALNSISSVLFD